MRRVLLFFGLAALCGQAAWAGAKKENAPDTIVLQTMDLTVPAEALQPLDVIAPDTAAKTGLIPKLLNYFEQSNVDKTLQGKKFDMTFIGGPHYSSAVGFGLGMVAAGMFRADREDLTIPPSNVSLFGDVTTTGFFMLGVRGNTYFKGAKYRIDYKNFFMYQPGGYWGVGYDAGADSTKSTYTRLQVDLKIDPMIRLGKIFYLGASFEFISTRGKKFTRPDYIPAGQQTHYICTAPGLFFMIDTRDVVTDPHKGIYFRMENQMFPAALGNTERFYRGEMFFDWYHKVWKGGTLAFDFHTQINSKGAPWTMLAELGGPFRMRGYYQGQYRDYGILEGQLELRQKIYGRSGAAAWVGAGNVFPNYKAITMNTTLPNYGIGYRWEFKKRVNVRLDLGFGKGQYGFIFNINEAF